MTLYPDVFLTIQVSVLTEKISSITQSVDAFHLIPPSGEIEKHQLMTDHNGVVLTINSLT
jgi:hypothetical protein